MIDNTADGIWASYYPNIEGMIETMVYRFMYRAKSTRHVNSTQEDLRQEAFIAAFIAMKTWDAQRKATLSTHVFNCIANRFRDLSKMAGRQPEYILDNDRQSSGFYGLEEVDHKILMEEILVPSDHDTYSKIFVYGYSVDETARIHCRLMGGDLQTHRKAIKSCVARILLKFQLSEKNQNPWMYGPGLWKSKTGMRNLLKKSLLDSGSSVPNPKPLGSRSLEKKLNSKSV